MLSLPFELKITIASNDEGTWFQMWLYDEDFRSRTHTEQFRKTFVDTFSTLKIDWYEVQSWQLFGKLHRGVTSYPPAIIFKDGSRQWWRYDSLHRENDLPAIIEEDGDQQWWQNGERHRGNDLPAIIGLYGDQEWWVNGKRHRDNDLPAVVYPYSDGTQEWWVNGKRHRGNDLPAVIDADGVQEWWVNGERHRVLEYRCPY